VNRLDQETVKRRGPTRAVEPFKKKKKMDNVQKRNICYVIAIRIYALNTDEIKAFLESWGLYRKNLDI
jgi:hypothetical protein